MLRLLKSKRGDEMVEATIVLPIVILVIVLLLRIFAFYLEILQTQVQSHVDAVAAWSSSEAAVMGIYEDRREVSLLGRGILSESLLKTIDTKAYLLNEDMIVRAGEIVND